MYVVSTCKIILYFAYGICSMEGSVPVTFFSNNTLKKILTMLKRKILRKYFNLKILRKKLNLKRKNLPYHSIPL